MIETKGDLFHKELNEFLDEVKNNGIAAIAYAGNEEERLRLLSFMQTVTRMEIKLKEALIAYEAEMVVELVKDDPDGIDEDMIAGSGGVIQTIPQTND